jgi:serine phosphatase RsbU (regulator of sigma subunit)/pSer/pThr/pTyr-binding forkhead associated (FHA) protein
MAILTSVSDNVVKQNFRLSDGKVTIGRHPGCDLHINDGSVSRKHAMVDFRDDAYYVQDLDSRNGTFLNDAKITGPTKLSDGAQVKICDVVFTFQDEEGPKTKSRESKKSSSLESNTGQAFLRTIVLQDIPSASTDSCVSQIERSSHSSQHHQHVSAEHKLRTLIKVARVLSESLERDEVLARILDFLFEHFEEADRGFIILKAADGSLLPLGCKTRRPQDEEQIRISKTIVNQVMKTGCPVISSDASADDRFDLSQSVMDFQIRSIMCAPLINNKDEAIGVVQLDTLRSSIVFTEEDLELLATIGMQASLTIKKADLFEEAKRSREMGQDLALAHELQSRFLPQKAPEVEAYSFASFYQPMQQVGGDYFDYVELDDEHVAIILADVVGHGIAAAMLMAKVSAESRFALATTKSASAAMERLNNKLTDMRLNRFVTLVLCLLNTKTNTLEIVNAGHMPPVIRRFETGELEELPLDNSGVPVGILPDFKYESSKISIETGDVVILYTDGLNEAMDADGNQLTTERMLGEVHSSQAKTPQAIKKVICDEVHRHMGVVKPIDDMCLVCFGRERP